MKSYSWILRILVAALIASFAPSLSSAQITSGKVLMDKIVIPAGAPEPVQFAASELNKYLKKSVGVDLPVVTGSPARGAFFITTVQVSPGVDKNAGEFAKEAGRKFDRSITAEREGCVYMVGENPRSALYAVYDFLQDRLGIRFYGTGKLNEVVPVHKGFKIKIGDDVAHGFGS